VVAVLVAVVRDCDGNNNGDSRLRFPGLDTACNKIKNGQSTFNTKLHHYRIKHYLMTHIPEAHFRQKNKHVEQ
jgi:hypothetical protein